MLSGLNSELVPEYLKVIHWILITLEKMGAAHTSEADNTDNTSGFLHLTAHVHIPWM